MNRKQIVNIFLCISILSFIFIGACRSGISENTPTNFIIISIDALHPDALNIKENAPLITSIMDKGIYNLNGKSIDPPKTLISHSAMFTGRKPSESGYTDNQWHEGDPVIDMENIFDLAYAHGMNTGYFYSKEKLGFLVSRNIRTHFMSQDYSYRYAYDFIKNKKHNFVFLHISGLENMGMEYGWLSKEYIAELRKIDYRLKTLIDYITVKKRFVIIITSDHAGHDKEHGTSHPDDYKLPFIYYSDFKMLNSINEYSVTDLFNIVNDLLGAKEK